MALSRRDTLCGPERAVTLLFGQSDASITATERSSIFEVAGCEVEPGLGREAVDGAGPIPRRLFIGMIVSARACS
jgi:hypothetical protein